MRMITGCPSFFKLGPEGAAKKMRLQGGELRRNRSRGKKSSPDSAAGRIGNSGGG